MNADGRRGDGPRGNATHVGALSLLSTVTVFGTAVDIALAELSIEAFYPADEATAHLLRNGGGNG